MDLVRDAGVDVSGWSDFEGGQARAASNPKYCYEWSFHVPGRLVILNIWFARLQEIEGTIVLEDNFRESVRFYAKVRGKTMWRKRAESFDRHVSVAAAEGLPVRTIICDGKMRARYDENARASRVKARVLDVAPWSVTSYDDRNGRFVLRRGALPHRLNDQFDTGLVPDSPTEVKSVTGSVFVRDPVVRREALRRAAGKCEWCGRMGFTTDDGSVFLETHHVVPLSEKGPDAVSNVAALCPNHHREAHYGSLRITIRERLLQYLNTGKPIAT